MSNKATSVYYDWLGELSRHGWQVEKGDAIRFNSGSETAKHVHAKTATARILKKNGYRVDSEVSHAERGTVDIAALPTKDEQMPFVVELETGITDEVKSDKLERYFEGSPFVECYIIELNKVSMDIMEMEQHIAEEIGIEV